MHSEATDKRSGAEEFVMDPLSAAIARMERTPNSGITMCHRQGKTAVYMSRDRKHIIEHAPDGTITKRPFRNDG